jgi:DNA-binding winged helix-turn-helix (wHTH) protein
MPRIVRFGLFEIDLSENSLVKEGRRIKLQDQPFRLLVLLLERAGETVTREQLKEALWSAHTFVDFDQSLNAAMAKLRQALGDSAENPRFIETQARRGYRFIAPVQGAVQLPRVEEKPPPLPMAPLIAKKTGRGWLVRAAWVTACVGAGAAVWIMRPDIPESRPLLKSLSTAD